ncbi:MAG: aminoacyl-tRNA hydrolase [Bacillota bacterium]
MKAIVGLGNPGEKYSKTRHNIGFRVVHELSKDLSIKADQLKCHSLIGTGFIEDEKIILAQPLTYMNNSGKAVKAILNHFNISEKDLIVIYDDLDLEPGKLRIKKNGSSGGHNGIKSIINSLGTRDFTRIRIGIGRPPEKVKVVDYVLGYFTEKEEELIQEKIDDAIKAIKLIEKNSVEMAMNKYN